MHIRQKGYVYFAMGFSMFVEANNVAPSRERRSGQAAFREDRVAGFARCIHHDLFNEARRARLFSDRSVALAAQERAEQAVCGRSGAVPIATDPAPSFAVAPRPGLRRSTKRWRVGKVGLGYASPVLVGNRVFVFSRRRRRRQVI